MRVWRSGGVLDREVRIGQRERNPALDPGRTVEHGRGERQHTVRNLVVDDRPVQLRFRSQVQPGRTVLAANQFGLEMKDAAIELARRSDRP